MVLGSSRLEVRLVSCSNIYYPGGIPYLYFLLSHILVLDLFYTSLSSLSGKVLWPVVLSLC